MSYQSLLVLLVMYMWNVEYTANIVALIFIHIQCIHVQWNSCKMTYNLEAQRDTSEIDCYVFQISKCFGIQHQQHLSLSLSLFVSSRPAILWKSLFLYFLAAKLRRRNRKWIDLSVEFVMKKWTMSLLFYSTKSIVSSENVVMLL